ncbi:MAG: hypothetical protein AB8B53_03025 [Flavobacteriales bacterium]
MNKTLNSCTEYRKVSFPVFIFLSVFIIFAAACRKAKTAEDRCTPCDCQPIPPSPSDQGYNFLSGNFSIKSTSFNPNNDDELVYSVINYSNGDRAVFKYDLTLEESVKIYDGQVKGDLGWGVNDWVLFTTISGHLWKVKSSGDSLTQLTFFGGASSSQWNSTADSIVFRKSAENISVVTDQNGNALDTLSDSFSGLGQSWNHPKYLSSTRLGFLTIKNIKDSTITNIHTLEDDRYLYQGCEDSELATGGVELVNDDIYYSHSLGIFKTDINGSSPVMIKESCTSQFYKNPSVNHSKNKLLFVRWDQKVVGDNENSVLTTQTLVTMNLDGSNEVELEVN